MLQLGGTIRTADLAVLPPGVVSELTAAAILKPVGDAWWLGGLMLMPFSGLWLLCQAARPNPTLYFGDDSIGLALHQSVSAGQTVLDLCAGPGIQSLRAAQMGGRVVAIEVNPAAAALATLNAAMNGFSDRIQVRVGNLYDAVGNEVFDRIVCNPPLLPMPDDLAYPFVGHGGPKGLRITSRVIDGLPRHLSPSGSGRIVGTTLSDGYLPCCIADLDEAAARLRLDLRMYVTAHHSLKEGSPYFDGLAVTSASTGDISVSAARSRYRAFLDSSGATHLCAFLLHIVPGSGRMDLMDVADDPPRDLWFAK